MEKDGDSNTALDLNPQQAQIIAAFLNFCLAEGVENATQQKIAKQTKIALSTLQYYFGQGKLDLNQTAVQWVAKVGREFTSQILLRESKKPSYQPVHAYLRTQYAWAKKYPAHASYWLYSHYQGSIQSKYRQFHADFLEGGRKRLESLIFEHYGRARKTPPMNVPDLAMQIHTMLHGSIIVGIVDSRGSLRAQEDLIMRWLEKILA